MEKQLKKTCYLPSRKGVKLSDETKQKMREAKKRFHFEVSMLRYENEMLKKEIKMLQDKFVELHELKRTLMKLLTGK